MDVKQAYGIWADQYDTNSNKTRDLEAVSLRTTLSEIRVESCLEIGCGTGKNTEWLVLIASHVTAVDLSEEMLAKAKQKMHSGNVQFINADITENWTFANMQFDLITFSLVLEHIENLDEIFRKVSKVLKPNGYVYLGELHPFKQYMGTKARFETEEGQQIVTCYNHNVSDFILSAINHGLEVVNVDEYFDDNDRTSIPRILTLLFRKKSIIR